MWSSRKLTLNAWKAFSRISTESFLSNSSSSSSFFSAFCLLIIPCLTHNSLFSLQNSIYLLCSSCDDKLLYNIKCCTRQPRGNHVPKVYFLVKKQRKCCKNTATIWNGFNFAAMFLQHFLLQISTLLHFLMGGPCAASYVHSSCRSAALFWYVWIKCCSSPLGFKQFTKWCFTMWFCILLKNKRRWQKSRRKAKQGYHNDICR